MSGTGGAKGSSLGFKKELTARIERLKAAVSETLAGKAPAAGFRAGAVIAVESAEEDYRYQGGNVALFNSLGCETLAAVSRALKKFGHAPQVLVLPAGTFWGKLSKKRAEEDAAELVRSLIEGKEGLEKSLLELKSFGTSAIVVGVDNPEGYQQVPVVLSVAGGTLEVRALARRADWDPSKDAGAVPDSYLGSRSVALDRLIVYVAYCSEIGSTEAGGIVKGTRLGGKKGAGIVVDLGHFFRRADAFAIKKDTPKSGVHRFLLACANAAAPDRLNAPALVSTALVGRDPRLDLDPEERPSFFLAVASTPRPDKNKAMSYWQPKTIQCVRAAAAAEEPGDILLTIHLFK